jgi:hypothetical protein
VLIAFMKLGISLLHIFSADGGAQSISTMPLDTYPAGAAQNTIALMARMGPEQCLLGLLFVVLLLRYRAMIPLIYLLVFVHYLGQTVITYMKPLALAGTSCVSTPAMVIAAMGIVGLVLSLLGKGYRNRVL